MASVDFIGFTFNGHHSSEYNIVRVSDGSRYVDSLLPTFQDKTVAVPGGDGTYFFDSFYTRKVFSIDIAYDSMTEENMRSLRRLIDTKEVGKLIFDEAPYKSYWVKINGQPQLKYICFGETGAQRIYKGEGSISFVSYEPYARSVNKFLNEYSAQDYPNKAEWSAASGLLVGSTVASTTYDTPSGSSSSTINVYNGGDIDTDFKLYFTVANGSGSTTTFKRNNSTIYQLQLGTFSAKGSDTHICIDTKTNLIEGCTYTNSTYTTTGNLYNEYIVAGDFFKIPRNNLTTSNNNRVPAYTDTITTNKVCAGIKYDYLYF